MGATGRPELGGLAMPVNDPCLVECLDTLIQTCRDGESGFRRCAEQARSMPLQWLLAQRAQRYHKDCAELLALRDEFVGGVSQAPPACRGGGTPHGWVAAEGLLATFSDLALLSECERGEHTMLQHYRRVLEEELPIVLRAVAQRHCAAAQSQRAQMRRLRATLLPATPPQQHPGPGAVAPRNADAQQPV